LYGDSWNDVNWTEFEAFIGLILLAGVYRSRNQALTNLWDAETGCLIFQAVISLQEFTILSRIIRFDNKSRSTRDLKYKLAAIHLPLMYNPGPKVTV